MPHSHPSRAARCSERHLATATDTRAIVEASTWRGPSATIRGVLAVYILPHPAHAAGSVRVGSASQSRSKLRRTTEFVQLTCYSAPHTSSLK